MELSTHGFLFICLLVFAIGDYFGALTKAKLSSVFVALLLFLIGFMTGFIPPDLISRAGLAEVSLYCLGFLCVHTGTMIDLKGIVKEWKTILMTVISMLIAWTAIACLIPIIGWNTAIATAPIINGGIVATQIMATGATEAGLTFVAGLTAMIFAVQKFVGTPPASHHGLKYARRALELYNKELEAGRLSSYAAEKAEAVAKISFCDQHKKYYTQFMCIAITAFLSWVSYELGDLTSINFSIWGIFLGMVFSTIGVIPKNILTQGGADGWYLICTFFTIVPALAGIKFSDLWQMAWQMIVIFGAVLALTYLVLKITPLWKIVGDKDLALGIAMIQLIGFPACVLVVNEISNAVCKTDGEREFLSNRLMVAYVIASIISISVFSIIAAGFFVDLFKV